MSTDTWIEIPSYGSPSWKSPVANPASLPATGNTNGDTRVDLSTDTIYVWNGTSWVPVATPGAAIAIDGLIGDVSASGPGVVVATVNSVGGASAANIAAASGYFSSNSGVLPVSDGGTGTSTAPTSGQLLIGNSTSGYNVANLTAGTGITISNGSGSVTINSSTSGSPTSIGTYDSQAGVANGLQIISNVLYAQSATASVPGMVNTSTQTFAGAKTFSGTVTDSVAPVFSSLTGYLYGNGSSAVTASTTIPGSSITGFTQGSVIFASASGQLSQDNANFYWNDSTFNLGLGIIPSSSVALDILNNSGAAKPVQETGYGGNVGFRSRRANGTLLSPTASINGDLLGFYSARGYGTTGFGATSTGVLNIVANETFTDTSMATYMQFEVTPSGSVTAAEAMRIAPTGNVLIGTITDNTTSKLQVNGTSSFIGNVIIQNSSVSTDYTTLAVDASDNFTITPSQVTSGPGGFTNINAGVGGPDNSNGGTMTIQAGTGGSDGTGGGNGGPTYIKGGVGAFGASTGGNGGGVAINGGLSAAIAGSAGGGVTLQAAAGSNTGSGGPGGSISINTGSAGGDNSINRAGGALLVSLGSSSGSSQGPAFQVSGGTGGVGTGTAGASGGGITQTAGTGGAGSATSGSGGSITLKGGVGGAGVAGGGGGAAILQGGTGGAGSSTGGNGGSVTVQGGTAAAVAGSAGGTTTITTGTGTSTGSGGAGGALSLTASPAGGDNTVNRVGGSVTINAGTSKGSSSGGVINLNAGAGGLGTGTAGATGGTIALTPGAGGVGSATGGTGGSITINGGLGGNSGTPGVGGTIIFKTAATTSLALVGTVTAAGLWGFGNNSTPTYMIDVLSGDIGIATAGHGLRVKEGSNARQGVATLSAGTVTVSTTQVTASSRIFLTIQSLGTVSVPSAIGITARSAGTSFTITSSANNDTSVIAYEIFEPY